VGYGFLSIPVFYEKQAFGTATSLTDLVQSVGQVANLPKRRQVGNLPHDLSAFPITQRYGEVTLGTFKV
jgi:hypothetical protein